MRVESPDAIVPKLESGSVDFYIHEDHWDKFKRIRRLIGSLSATIDIEIGWDWWESIADWFFAWASVTSENLRIRLTITALAIYELANRINITAYQVISEPDFPYSFPLTFGDYYEIEPV